MAEGARSRSPSERAVDALKARLDPEQDGLLRLEATQRDELARFRFRLPEDYLGQVRDLVIAVGTNFRKQGLAMSIDPDPGLHWPHVLQGSVCLFAAGQRPQTSEPSDVVNECIERFHKLMHWVIDGSDVEAREDEFYHELKSYWYTQLNSHLRPLRLLQRPSKSSPLFALSEARVEGRIRAELLASDVSQLEAELGRLGRRKERVQAPLNGAFYAKFNSKPSVQLPSPAEIFTWAESYLSAEDAAVLRSWASTSAGLPLRWLIVELPSTDPIQEVAFAVHHSGAHPRAQPHYGKRAARRRRWGPPAVSAVGALHTSRLDVLDEAVIFSRNEEESLPALRQAHVLMIGAGCLGSMVASHLVRAGVGRLTIFDPQLFGAENLGRHELGLGDLNQSKAEALAARLQADSHTCIVRGFPGTHIEALRDVQLMSEVDVVVVTTADVPSERAVWALKAANQVPWSLVHGWAEPHGFVAHALAAPVGNFDARPLFDDFGRFHSAFTHWPGNGVRTQPACGVGYIPAGPLAIGAAASLVANAVVHVLADPPKAPVWHYVVNDPDRVSAKQGNYSGPDQPANCRQWTQMEPWPSP